VAFAASGVPEFLFVSSNGGALQINLCFLQSAF
jgi:hypothetical protein